MLGWLLNPILLVRVVLGILVLISPLTVFSQDLEWFISTRDTLRSPRWVATGINAIGNREFVFGADTSADGDMFLYRADPFSKSLQVIWRERDYPKRRNNPTNAITRDGADFIIVSRRGLGRLSIDGKFTTYYDHCLDTTHVIDAVRSESTSDFTILLSREQKPAQNGVWAKRYLESWKNGVCTPLWEGYALSPYGYAYGFFRERNGEEVLLFDHAMNKDSVLMRKTNGTPVQLTGMPHVDKQSIASIWQDDWGWTMVLQRRLSPAGNYLARFNNNFELIDTLNLGPLRNPRIKRNGRWISIVTGVGAGSDFGAVLMVELPNLRLWNITSEAVQDDLKRIFPPDYIETRVPTGFEDADFDGQRLYLSSSAGVFVYAMPTTSYRPHDDSNRTKTPCLSPLAVDGLHSVPYRKIFGSNMQQVRLFNLHGVLLDSGAIENGHVVSGLIMNPTKGVYQLVCDNGKAVLVLIL
jgi:hypothetical protein